MYLIIYFNLQPCHKMYNYKTLGEIRLEDNVHQLVTKQHQYLILCTVSI